MTSERNYKIQLVKVMIAQINLQRELTQQTSPILLDTNTYSNPNILSATLKKLEERQAMFQHLINNPEKLDSISLVELTPRTTERLVYLTRAVEAAAMNIKPLPERINPAMHHDDIGEVAAD